jgi:hypothetical protein
MLKRPGWLGTLESVFRVRGLGTVSRENEPSVLIVEDVPARSAGRFERRWDRSSYSRATSPPARKRSRASLSKHGRTQSEGVRPTR